jgi:hypothetical protein
MNINDESKTENARQLAELISELGYFLAAKRGELSILWRALDVREAELLLEVWNAKDAEGKAVYGNDKTRSAALTLECECNAFYQDARRKVDVAEAQIANLAVELELARNRFRLELADYQWATASVGLLS